MIETLHPLDPAIFVRGLDPSPPLALTQTLMYRLSFHDSVARGHILHLTALTTSAL